VLNRNVFRCFSKADKLAVSRSKVEDRSRLSVQVAYKKLSTFITVLFLYTISHEKCVLLSA